MGSDEAKERLHRKITKKLNTQDSVNYPAIFYHRRKDTTMATTKKETSLVASNGALELTGKGKDLYSKLNEFVKEALVEEEHYGKIKGTNKPSLFKGGAELLAKEADLVPTFETLFEKIDFDKPFFAYMVKCTLHRDGEKISEAMGGCNSMERKFISGNIDKYFLFNNVPKMAEKRAYVSAVVRAWGLSGIFTQDMEDLEANPVEEEKKEKEFDRFASLRSTYFAQKVIKEMSEEQRHEWNEKYIGKESTKDWDMKEWQKACELARLQSNPIEFNVEPEKQPEKEEPDLRKLLIGMSDKFGVKEADLLQFFEAGYINSDKNMSEDMPDKLRSLILSRENDRKFNHSFNSWKAWQNKYNGTTEAILNALACCKDRNPIIVSKFFNKLEINNIWAMSTEDMQNWQQTLADVMSGLDIEQKFIMKVCPEAVPF